MSTRAENLPPGPLPQREGVTQHEHRGLPSTSGIALKSPPSHAGVTEGGRGVRLFAATTTATRRTRTRARADTVTQTRRRRWLDAPWWLYLVLLIGGLC